MPVLAYELTRSPVVVSLVAASATLPYLFFGLVAGAVADRTDRRRLMIIADVLNSMVLASVPVAATFGALSPVHIVAAALVSASLFIFFDAGLYGFIPVLVGKENLTRVNSSIYGAETVVRIVGTAVAGTLIAVMRPSGVLLVDAVSFLASAILIRTIGTAVTTREPARENRPKFRASIAEGLRFLWRHPTLRTLTMIGTLQSFSGGAVIGQLVIFADRVLDIHGSDPRIGFLYTAWSGGGVLGSILLPRLLRRTDAIKVLLFALPASSLLGLAVVLSGDWRIALVTLTAWGSAYLLIIINTMTYSQQTTPAELQGRVNTTRRMLSSGLGVPLGALVASTVTVQFTIRAGMLMAVIAVGLASVVVWIAHLRGTLGRAPA